MEAAESSAKAQAAAVVAKTATKGKKEKAALRIMAKSIADLLLPMRF
jgi:CII-binding regulator of phage lambda lysogenization HflD